MDLSVVVPTLNGRTQLLRCLDALSAHAPTVEVIVVNGPSTDGTTGAVREREDVDVLVEIADRNLNVARNAGVENASGEWVAFVSDEYSIEPAWSEALGEAAREETLGTDSRLAGAVDSIAGAGTALADATRSLTDRSKRLATRGGRRRVAVRGGEQRYGNRLGNPEGRSRWRGSRPDERVAAGRRS
ncbi:hypothetical protein BRC77_08735 [Halobacteriales archaeon QH_8_64_26]|nr:MAG: hypothetical protein BRC77_08735 [Halobacteriales archaeon QH_8_64_26]